MPKFEWVKPGSNSIIFYFANNFAHSLPYLAVIYYVGSAES